MWSRIPLFLTRDKIKVLLAVSLPCEDQVRDPTFGAK